MKDLDLGKEVQSFENDNGKLIEVERYYIVLRGIKLYVKPDATAKQLIDVYCHEKGVNK